MDKYYDSTNLFAPKKRLSERAPDFRGDVELSPELCEYIVRRYKSGEQPVIGVSLWRKQGAQAGEYFKCKVKEGWKPDAAKESAPPKKEYSDEEIPF